MEKYPLIKFVIIFICGILIEYIVNLDDKLLFIISATILAVVIFLYFFRKNLLLISFVLPLAILLVSMSFFAIFSNEKISYLFEEPKIKNMIVSGYVADVDLMKNGKINFYLNSDSVVINGIPQKLNTGFLCIYKDSQKKLNWFYSQIKIGNKLKITGTVYRIRNQRNPGEFDYENYLLNRGISSVSAINSRENIKITSAKKDWFNNAVFNVRKSIDEKIISVHNKTTGGFLRGLILGDRSLIENEIQTGFINAGVVHVLSVSGLHVGFIILLFVLMFQRFNIYVKFILSVLGLVAYVIITNFQPPVTRSAIMGAAILFGPVSGRNYNSLNSLALSAFVILLFNPDDLFNPGFQLSFAAMLSLILLYPPINSKINSLGIKSKFTKNALLFCSVSLAAQLGTLPFTLVYFHKLSLVSLLANIIVIPLSGFVVQLGIFTIVLAYAWSYLSLIFAAANELLTFLLLHFVKYMGGLGVSFVRINEFSIYDGIIFYLVLIVIWKSWKHLLNYKSKLTVSVLSVLLLFVLMGIDNYKLLPDNKLSVMAIDIGQGDAFLIKFPNNEYALIDAGEANEKFDNGEKVVKPLLENLGVEKIDYGVITHMDNDHYSGFISLVKNNFIKRIIKPLPDSSDFKEIQFSKLLEKYSVPVSYNYFYQNRIGNAGVYILTKNKVFNNSNFDSNDRSIVIKIIYGGTSFLFTGDAGKRVENIYINIYGDFLQCDVLKVGHHGSRTSSGENFISKVKPKIALISAGVANRFNHPHENVIELFSKNKIQILRTDLNGAIILTSDGKTVQNINWKKQHSRFIF